jgi:hypothetical protein
VDWRALVLAVFTFGFGYQSQLISEMDLRRIGCVAGRWMELAQDRILWQALVLAALKLLALLPYTQLVSSSAHYVTDSLSFI